MHNWKKKTLFLWFKGPPHVWKKIANKPIHISYKYGILTCVRPEVQCWGTINIWTCIAVYENKTLRPAVFELRTCGLVNQSFTHYRHRHSYTAIFTVKIAMLWRTLIKSKSHGLSRILNNKVIWLLSHE